MPLSIYILLMPSPCHTRNLSLALTHIARDRRCAAKSPSFRPLFISQPSLSPINTLANFCLQRSAMILASFAGTVASRRGSMRHCTILRSRVSVDDMIMFSLRVICRGECAGVQKPSANTQQILELVLASTKIKCISQVSTAAAIEARHANMIYRPAF